MHVRRLPGSIEVDPQQDVRTDAVGSLPKVQERMSLRKRTHDSGRRGGKAPEEVVPMVQIGVSVVRSEPNSAFLQFFVSAVELHWDAST